jgi:xanthine dehydrogenase accessory factor
MVLNFYQKVLQQLEAGEALVLMVVIKSTGSSPGRQGFLQMVTANVVYGTIGGGIMEHKWITLARELLAKGPFLPFAKLQVHRPEAGENRSGMICSGEQVIAFYYFDSEDMDIIKSILSPENTAICYRETGIFFANQNKSLDIENFNENKWQFVQSTKPEHRVFIFGAGHVGLALCRALSVLDFEVTLFDDRSEIQLKARDTISQKVQLIRYEDSHLYVTEGAHHYVVVMSAGYLTDEVILRSLRYRKFSYLGMLGSRQKVNTLKQQLLQEGFDAEWLQAIIAPAGIDIKSETPEEIAISIAAQLVAVKNGKDILNNRIHE